MTFFNFAKNSVTMYIVHVFVQVKEGYIEDFKQATAENARNSLMEEGIARFDVLQQENDPTWFVLQEVYRTAEDPAKHKETDHYKKWRDAVEVMMAVPRSSIRFANLFPNDEGWG
jgi:(4S)-4-hydroxy-5-phosphonooxypentane-2,3-dione isomerase